MEYIILFLCILFLLFIKGVSDERKRAAAIREEIENSWGTKPECDYSSKRFASIAAYYRSNVEKDTDIDDITWNDLNMDEIYKAVNHTCSSIGEEYLYATLRKLVFDEDELKKRSDLIRYFTTHKKEREDLQHMLLELGKLEDISLYEYIHRTDEIEIKNPFKHYLFAFGVFAAFGLLFVDPLIGVIALLAMITNNIIQYSVAKAKINSYLSVFSYILGILNGVDKIKKVSLPGLEEYVSSLEKNTSKFASFRRGAGIALGGRGVLDGFFDIFIDYIRMIFHIDLMKFNSMLSTLRNNKDALNEIYNTIGILDSMMAVASFREMIGTCCEPKLTHDKKPFVEAKELYHPLISNPVKNSISEKNCVLLTGSNASGKSTFLRTVAINAILSQTIYTSTASSYKASYVKVYSSMALTDNIFNNESYYMAEIKSLKRIIDQIDGKIPVLCFVDEVLRGTNTVERISASSEILNYIAGHNVLCFAATHDVELTYILESKYANYHFQETVKHNDVLFDYKLYRGKATSKNAIKLLSVIGYDRSIIDAANKRANTFVDTGEWLAF